MRTVTLTQKKHGAQALEHIALETQLLASACLSEGLSGGKSRAAGWHRGLPAIPSEVFGYERQVLVAMQLGLYVLHYRKGEEPKPPCPHLLADASGKRCLACGEVRDAQALRGAA